ncbi:Transmembrane protein C9orf91-like protein [Armadillidium nasatum]|uniref:Transmembrane protein C9orf91-like protein n=1 Tax=Armadillidium nasatum TaxID=96803 RepID=A0A5N5TPC1_9CRUS|nr:Transmembrane protein C9orf91-like protein [Armadillidium nasatum]
MSTENAKNTAESPKGWVQFDEENSSTFDENQSPTSAVNDSPAVLETQPVQVTLENNRTNVDSTVHSPTKGMSRSNTEPLNGSLHSTSVPLRREASSVNISPLNPAHLQNVPLSESTVTRPPRNFNDRPPVRQGFANGDVIVTILPQNSSLPWITPAKFRPELVPEELMAQGLTLTVEDYVHVMSQLINDHRFTLYNICYKRILMAWITLAFIILLCILFANFQHFAMFGAGIAWLMVNAGAIFLCMWIKIKLNKNLERCLSRINMQLMKHKILLGVDDRGKISCHKINLCFIYFDPHECIGKLQQLINQDQTVEGLNGNKNVPSLSDRYDIENPDIIITGATNRRITQQQKKAESLLARYSQRWVKLIVRGGLALGIDAADRRRSHGGSLTPSQPQIPPRHMASRQCPCQYIEEHLQEDFPLN